MVDGLANARDLGDLPLTGGGVTPSGVFFRSETVDRVTARGWAQLRTAGIRTIVDLRRPDERELDRGTRPDWLTTVPVDLDGPLDGPFWERRWQNGIGACSADYYLPHLDAMPERTGAALIALAGAPPGGVLFHCAGGRDRTGLVAMVLLRLAGVEPEAIVDDYLETLRRGDLIAELHQMRSAEPRIAELLAATGTTPEREFRSALAGLDVEALPRTAGLDDGARTVLGSWRRPGSAGPPTGHDRVV